MFAKGMRFLEFYVTTKKVTFSGGKIMPLAAVFLLLFLKVTYVEFLAAGKKFSLLRWVEYLRWYEDG